MTPPGTTLRAIRIPQDLWDAAATKARRLDTSVSEKVRDMLQAWVDEDDSDGAMMLGSGEVHRSATTPMMTRDDFRIRKTPRGFRVWQRIGSGWEAMSDVWATRAEARAWIDDAFTTSGGIALNTKTTKAPPLGPKS